MGKFDFKRSKLSVKTEISYKSNSNMQNFVVNLIWWWRPKIPFLGKKKKQHQFKLKFDT